MVDPVDVKGEVALAIEAHRGASAVAPENTLAAFEAAVAAGASWIECDVQASADGRLLVIHDEAVDRTTDGTGLVRNLAAAALRELDAGRWFAPAFAGERIPLLEEALDLILANRIRLNIEIKESGLGRQTVPDLVRLLQEYDCRDRVIVSSFALQPLVDLRRLDDEVALGLIGDAAVVLSQARAHGIPWIHCQHASMDADLAQRARAAGIRLHVWTVDDPATLPHWAGLGVERVCSNDPGLLLGRSR